MKFTRHHFMLLLAIAIAPLAAIAVITGHPVTEFLPHDLVAALGLAGMGMAGTFKNYALNIAPVAPGKKAIITIGCGPNAPTLDKIVLLLGGANYNASKINGIVGKINREIAYDEAGGTVHNARRTYLGATVATDRVVIDLIEPNSRSAIEQNLSAWPLSLMKSCTFEIDNDATSGADMTLDAELVFRAPTSNSFVKKLKHDTFHFGGGGAHNIPVPSGEQSGGKLVRAWIHESAAGNITKATLRSKNAIGIEGTRAALQADQADWDLVPQAGVFVVDFIEDGNLAGWFDTQKLADATMLMLTGTAACTYEVYWEWLDPIGRL